jgi:hypothetical protein
VALQQQTLADARDLLPTFEIFDENDEVRFRHSLSVDRPRMVVLKKVTRPLRSWLQVLNPLALGGQPLFIIDDEADATGQNTRVNQNDQSEINRLIDRLVRDNAAYMLQVTATPQAVLLQDSDSLFRPQAQLMFSPGPNYLGGDFFFPLWTLDGDGRPFHLVDTDEDELSQLEDSSISDLPVGLRSAILTFWLTAAFRLEVEGDKQCNFLLHPSARTVHHAQIQQKVDEFLLQVRSRPGGILEEPSTEAIYQSLRATKPQLPELQELAHHAERTRLVTHVLNSRAGNNSRSLPSVGASIFIGGNVLSRGIVVPRLQTAYYCRKARAPQLDTYWQHSRMFGYDRDPALIRMFMPPSLFRLFAQINESVSNLFGALESGVKPDVAIVVPKGVRPTRASVVRGLNDSCLVGGSIYFPFSPDQRNLGKVDKILTAMPPDVLFMEVSLDIVVDALLACGDNAFGGIASSEIPAVLENCRTSATQVLLAARTKREISANTGTVLSQTDRELMLSYPGSIFLMLYQVTGSKELGWSGERFWIPNIKIPEGRVAFVRP